MKAVLIKSVERYDAFHEKLNELKVDCTDLDFLQQRWVDFDYADTDFLIYYPSFDYSSSYPLSLFKVHDNLINIHLYCTLKP